MELNAAIYLRKWNEFAKNKQLHAVSCKQQSRQREPSVKTLSIFPPNSGGIACWVAELNAELCSDTRAKRWKYKFNLITYNDYSFKY